MHRKPPVPLWTPYFRGVSELGPKQFYNAQFAGNEYARRDPARSEAEDLRRFVEAFGLEEERVLEIGCGRGSFQDLVANWVGVDYSPVVARHVQKPFVAASAVDLPFPDESFDGIWSVTVLEHVPQPERALEEIARVLRPEGVALLAPAWHCRPWAADGYEVRPWSDFGWKGKLTKASIPLRKALWFRAAGTLPVRLWREGRRHLQRNRAMRFRYGQLRANYETFWTADSDACNAMDPHEVALWFLSRGWSVPSHNGFWSRLLVRAGAVIVRKPRPEP